MTKAPPAEQAMHRNSNRDAEGVGGNLKLDASELDGCWLVYPDNICKFCCGTHIHVQKHVDADTVVSKSVELSVLSACLPCFCPFFTWVCCPEIFLGLRAHDAGDAGKNSFDYIKVHENSKEESDSPDPDGLSMSSDKYYAPGFKRLGQNCDKSRNTPLNEENKTWQYSGASKATSRPWRTYSSSPKEGERIAVRCAPACCMPTSFNRDRQLLAAYYSGYRRKDDHPLTAMEQDDKEVCAAAFAGALEVGNIPSIRRYRPVIGALKPDHVLVLAGNGHVEALKWAREEGVEFPPNICLCAASSGNVNVLECCKENLATCRSDDVMAHAMKSGSVECVEYCLKTLKLPWGERSTLLASEIGPEMLKYCLDNGAPADEDALGYALRRLHVEIVKVFAESSHPFPTEPRRMEIHHGYDKDKCEQIESICASRRFSLEYIDCVPPDTSTYY